MNEMLKVLFRIVVRNVGFRKCFGRRKNHLMLFILVASVFLLWYTCWWLIIVTSRALLPPPQPDPNLDHYRRNRNLAYYMQSTQLLIEPSSIPCAIAEEVLVIIMVTSAPQHFEQRQAIRETWGKHLPTYFVLGLYGSQVDEQLVDNYIEAKQYSDMIVFDFQDHYQNLTLKTALMMRWVQVHCPLAQFMFKTDDDVLVNPWTLKTVLKENRNAKLLGYKIENIYVHRSSYNKWYMPRWLHSQELVPQYLSGTGYLISGEYLQRILKEANKVPLVNLEDIYFTYLVAHRNLRLSLSHDRRLNPYKPLLGLSCAYWSLASTHSMTPDEMVTVWSKIENMAKYNSSVCSFYNTYIDSDLFFY